MKRVYLRKIVFALAFMLCFGGSVQCMAQAKPLWAQKGEKYANKKRKSDSYTFKVFNTHSLDAPKLKREHIKPLLEYLHEEYGADVARMTVDSSAVTAEGRRLYKVSFPSEGGTSSVYAQRVDDYIVYEDYELNVFQFEYYQLYAVTNKNAEPAFDDFEICETNNSTALARSIVPGLGQFYKGQTAKGCVILGGEAALITTAIVCQVHKHRYDKKADNQIPNVDSWKSKARSWRQMRDISLGLACGLYVYNLIDAATAKGPRRLNVRSAGTHGLAVAPWAGVEGAGLSFAWRF